MLGASGFGRMAQNDIKACPQLANARFLHLRKIDGHGGTCFGIADAAVHSILGVAALAFDIALRGKQFLAVFLDLEGPFAEETIKAYAMYWYLVARNARPAN